MLGGGLECIGSNPCFLVIYDLFCLPVLLGYVLCWLERGKRCASAEIVFVNID